MSYKRKYGEWSVSSCKRGATGFNHYIAVKDYGALGYWDNVENQWGLKEQDAKLIAAAPEMLTALRSLVRMYGSSSHNPDEDDERIARAKKIISKASVKLNVPNKGDGS